MSFFSHIFTILYTHTADPIYTPLYTPFYTPFFHTLFSPLYRNFCTGTMIVPQFSVLRHMNDRGVAYGRVGSDDRVVSYYPGVSQWKVNLRAPVPFTGAREGMVYTMRNGRVGYYPDTGMQQEYYPSTFSLGEASFDSVLDFCTDHLKILYPNHVSVIEFVCKHVKSNNNNNNIKCDVDVMLPGHHSWIPLKGLDMRCLFQFKVTQYQKPSVRTERIVLFPDAFVGDLVRHVERQFGVDLDSFDLKPREGNWDVSDLAISLSELSVPRLAALTLQHKDLQGKPNPNPTRGKMMRGPPPARRIVTFGEFRGGFDDDDDDDDDGNNKPKPKPKQPTRKQKPQHVAQPEPLYLDDFDPIDEEPEVINKRKRPRMLDVAVGNGDAKPVLNDLGNGRIIFGFEVSADQTHLLSECFTPAAYFHMDTLIKDSKKRARQEKKQQQLQQQM